jgi:hypothetical protein
MAGVPEYAFVFEEGGFALILMSQKGPAQARLMLLSIVLLYDFYIDYSKRLAANLRLWCK